MAEDGHLLHDWTSRTPSLLDGRIVLSGRVDGTVVMFVMNDDFERTRDELFQGDQVTSSCGKVYRLGVPQAPAEQPPDVEIRQRDLAAYAAEAADRLGRRADPAEPTITITSAQSLPVATVVEQWTAILMAKWAVLSKQLEAPAEAAKKWLEEDL